MLTKVLTDHELKMKAEGKVEAGTHEEIMGKDTVEAIRAFNAMKKEQIQKTGRFDMSGLPRIPDKDQEMADARLSRTIDKGVRQSYRNLTNTKWLRSWYPEQRPASWYPEQSSRPY